MHKSIYIQRKWVGLLSDLTEVGGAPDGTYCNCLEIKFKWVGLVMDYSWWVELLMGHFQKVGWKSKVHNLPL